MLLVIAATVAIVCVLYLVTRSAERDLANKVDAYGANIVVVPLTKDLPLTYGGVSLGGLTYDVRSLRMTDLEKIRAIPDKQNVNNVAPKLIGAVDVGGVRLLGAGVDWKQELALKKWWQITGSRPQGDHDVLLGSRAAAKLGLQPGATVPLNGETFRVAGVLGPTGTQEDDLLYLDLATAQRLWQRPGEISLIEVSAFCSTCPIEEINAADLGRHPHRPGLGPPQGGGIPAPAHRPVPPVQRRALGPDDPGRLPHRALVDAGGRA